MEDGSIRVLVVDDDSALANLVAEYVPHEDDRLVVETATSAREGLDRLAAAGIDCIVSDYDMPGLDGLELLEAVRESHPDLPFVLFTGKGSEGVASEAIYAGVTDYLQKGTGTDQYALLANRITNAVEHARAEQARDRHLAVIESAHEGISILDCDGRFVYVNETYADLYGYDADEMLGERWELIYPEDEVRVAREEILPTVEREQYWHGETTGLRADGSTFVEDHTLATTDHGELICIVSDVSDRHEYAADLELRTAAMEAAMDGIAILDADGEYVYMNESHADVFGYGPEELIGRNWRRLYDADETARFDEQVFPELERTGEWRGETVGRTRTGESVHVEVTLSLLDDGTLICTNRDVTEQKRRESELEAARERYESLFENNPLTVWEEDFTATKAALDELREEVEDVEQYLLDHPAELRRLLETIEVVDVNWNAIEYYGAESKADLVDNLGRLFTDEAYEVAAAELAAVANGDRRFRADTVYRSFDGERHDEMLDLYIPRSAAGDYSRVFLTDTDITDRKEKERELRRERDRLEEFASFVSHDLRNPLSVASGNLALVREECESDRLAPIGRALDRMDQLITDLLTLAREGEAVGEVHPVSLAHLVPDCWRNVETGDASLAVDAAPTILADRSRMTTLLENLLRNSVEHGGRDVRVTVGGLADEAGFYVADDGPGIAPAERARVFESGYSTNSDGTGIGLTIVQQIAEAHGWEVSVTESADGGARFEIRGVETEAAPVDGTAGGHTG